MSATPPSGPSGPTRRALLGAGALLPVGLTAGCRVRLEDGAPRVPGVPTREPTEDEGLLLTAWHDATDLLRMSRAAGAPAAGAARLHSAHCAVLDQELRDRRVPQQAITAAASPTATSASPPGASTTPAVLPQVALAQREAAAWTGDAVAALAGAHEHRIAQLASFATCRARLASGLGAPVAWPAWGATPTAADGLLLTAHREARYLLQVATARTPAPARPPLQAALARVDGVVVRLESRATGSARTSPGTAAAGYRLPFAVTDPASARRLVTHALGTLELRCGAAWPVCTGDAAAVVTVSRLVHDTVAAGAGWGVPLRAFPGLAP